MAWNQLLPNASLAVGQLLRLTPPTAGGPVTYQPQPTGPPSAAVWHTVLASETLYSLAHRYGVSVADLQTWNNKPGANVRLGEVLRMNAPPGR